MGVHELMKALPLRLKVLCCRLRPLCLSSNVGELRTEMHDLKQSDLPNLPLCCLLWIGDGSFLSKKVTQLCAWVRGPPKSLPATAAIVVKALPRHRELQAPGQREAAAELEALREAARAAASAAAQAEQRAAAAEAEAQRLSSELELMQVHAHAAASAPDLERRYREVGGLPAAPMRFRSGPTPWEYCTRARSLMRSSCPSHVNYLVMPCKLQGVSASVVWTQEGKARGLKVALQWQTDNLSAPAAVAGHRAAVPEADAAGGAGGREGGGAAAAGAPGQEHPALR